MNLRETTKTPHILPTLVLTATLLLFFREILFGSGALFYYDLIGFNAPVRNFFFGEITGGNFPLWSPYTCGGFPLFAEGQTGPLYLLNWPIFPLFDPPTAINLSVMVHLALAAAGTYAWLQRSRSKTAALAGAIYFTFSSYLVFHLIHLMLFQSACLLPWLFYFFDRYLDTGRRSDLLEASLTLGVMFTTGHQQGPVMASMGFALFVFVIVIEKLIEKNPGAGRLTVGALFVFVVAAVMASTIIYSIMELVSHSVRQEAMAGDFIYSGSIVPELLPRLASPFHNGRWLDGTWQLFSLHEKEVAIYLGLAAFLFAPLALVGAGTRERAHLAVVLFGLLYILGNAGPFTGLLEQIPVINRMRVPARFLLPMTLALTYLTASGIDRLKQGVTFRLAAALIGAGAFLWFALAFGGGIGEYGAALLFPDQAMHPTPAKIAMLQHLRSDLLFRAVLCAAMAVAALWIVRAKKPGSVLRFFPAALVLLIFVDLFSVGYNENPVADKAVYGPFETVDYLQKHLGEHRIFSTDSHLPYSAAGWAFGTEAYRYGIEGLPQSTSMLFGIRSLSCGTPLAFARQQRVTAQVSVSWLRRASVAYLLSRKQLSLPVAMQTPRVTVYGVPQPADYYSLATGTVLAASEDEAFESAGAPVVDLNATAIVEDKAALLPTTDATSNGRVSVVDESTDRRTLLVTSSGPAFVVLRENYHPGWKAVVDGNPAPVYRADYLFFGVPVSPGSHTVVFEFDPPLTMPLLYLGLVAFIVVFIAALTEKMRTVGKPLIEPSHANNKFLAAQWILFAALLLIAVLRHPALWIP